MKPRPSPLPRIDGFELRPVGDGIMTFHMLLTDEAGNKMPFVLSRKGFDQFTAEHIKALGFVSLQPAGMEV